ncbi:MAG: glycosyltransferase family 1 protein [Burkholderia gladioli]
MSNIFLDVSRLLTRLSKGQRPTGVDRVGLAYVERYGPQARAVLSEQGFVHILSQRDSQRVFRMLLAGRTPGKVALRTMIALSLLRSLFRRETSDGGCLLHTSHNGMEFRRYYATLRKYRIRSAFMVHDLIPLTHAEYCRPNVDIAHRQRIRSALQHADGLIANSQDTMNALRVEADNAGVALPHTVVAHLAPGIQPAFDSPRLIDEPYFVILGTIEPRKNHWLMLHVWRQLVQQLGSAAPKLVIIGRRGWECENVVDMLERCEALRGIVIEEPDCSDERMQAWLAHSRALLFPSFVEGYGMPLVEALALYVPVIASNLDVFHEIAADIPDYLDPLDGPAWIRHIAAYAQPDSLERADQVSRIAAFRAPSWHDHFDNVDRLLKTLI